VGCLSLTEKVTKDLSFCCSGVLLWRPSRALGGGQTNGIDKRGGSAGNLIKVHRDGDRSLQLLVFNEEFLVSASHQLALITSLPFVHTARRSYRLGDPVKRTDSFGLIVGKRFLFPQTSAFLLSVRWG
jgi:hypothetical protein